MTPTHAAAYGALLDALDAVRYPLTPGARAALATAALEPSAATYAAAAQIALTPPTDRRAGLTLADLIGMDPAADTANPGAFHILDALHAAAARSTLV